MPQKTGSSKKSRDHQTSAGLRRSSKRVRLSETQKVLMGGGLYIAAIESDRKLGLLNVKKWGER